MFPRHPLARLSGALALCIASSAFAQSDREITEGAIALSADVCPGHSKDRTTPTVRQVPVGALRVLRERGFVMCPDRRLDPGAPAIWYGEIGAYAWNPEVEGADKVIVKQIDAMTRKEEFPMETLVWDAQGKALQNQTVPRFEARPGIIVRVRKY